MGCTHSVPIISYNDSLGVDRNVVELSVDGRSFGSRKCHVGKERKSCIEQQEEGEAAEGS